MPGRYFKLVGLGKRNRLHQTSSYRTPIIGRARAVFISFSRPYSCFAAAGQRTALMPGVIGFAVGRGTFTAGGSTAGAMPLPLGVFVFASVDRPGLRRAELPDVGARIGQPHRA
jgi:hypothetical protein